MEYAEDIRSNVKNIQYYAKEIEKACSLQLDKDCEVGNVTGIALDPCSLRFEALVYICSSVKKVINECNAILINTKTAEAQDSKMIFKEEKIEELPNPNEIIQF